MEICFNLYTRAICISVFAASHRDIDSPIDSILARYRAVFDPSLCCEKVRSRIGFSYNHDNRLTNSFYVRLTSASLLNLNYCCSILCLSVNIINRIKDTTFCSLYIDVLNMMIVRALQILIRGHDSLQCRCELDFECLWT